MNVRTKMSTETALRLVGQTTFSEFTEVDWMAFSGCECANPRIGRCAEFTVVIDGDMVMIIHDEDRFGGQLFYLNAMQ
jgi:hypothetical protein